MTICVTVDLEASAQERTPCQMHPAQCQITDRSHSEMLLAGGAQGSFRRADRGAYFREIDRSARVRLEIFLEMRDDRFVTSAARSRVVSVASGETANQNAKKRIVDRSKNFRRRQDVGRLLRQQADHPVQRSKRDIIACGGRRTLRLHCFWMSPPVSASTAVSSSATGIEIAP